MKQPYQLLIFDWDGTVVDSIGRITQCLHLALTAMNEPERPHNELKQVIGLGLQEALEMLAPGKSQKFYDDLVEAYRHYWLGNNVVASNMFEGIEVLLRQLHQSGFVLSVATGKSRRGLTTQFEETGLGDVFSSSRCADECASKPAPDMVHEIMREHDLGPEQTLVIGDTTYDMEMAQRAECARLGVTYGVHSASELDTYTPIDLLESPEALIGWFERHYIFGKQGAA